MAHDSWEEDIRTPERREINFFPPGSSSVTGISSGPMEGIANVTVFRWLSKTFEDISQLDTGSVTYPQTWYSFSPLKAIHKSGKQSKYSKKNRLWPVKN